MTGNMQSGLFLVGLGSAILFGWWTGAFAMIGEEVVAAIRAPAGAGRGAAAAPVAPASNVIPFPTPVAPAASA